MPEQTIPVAAEPAPRELVNVSTSSPVRLREEMGNISLYYTNADSLGNKFNELQALASTNNYEIICITETLPKHSINPDDISNYTFSLSNYIGYHTLSGRGVSIYVHENLKSEAVSFDANFSDNLWVNLETSPKKYILLGCLYRSPNSSESNNESLVSMLKESKSKNAHNRLIVGDFNLKEIDWVNFCVHTRPEHTAMKVFDVVNDLFYEQLIDEPTRHRAGERPNLLDWVLTDNSEMIENICVGPPLGTKGDHNSIELDIVLPRCLTYSPEKLNLYKGNYAGMIKSINSVDWESKLGVMSCSQAWDSFHNFMQTCIKEHIPVFKEKLKKKKNIWVNSLVKSAIKEKNRAWNQYKKNKSDVNWKNFTCIRNKTNKIVSANKANFELKIANEIKSNPKQFWKYVKSKSSASRDFPRLVDNEGMVYDNDSAKAELFNSYFSSVFTAEDTSSIPTPTVLSNSNLSSITISPDIVLKYLQKINTSKSAGPDGIHSKVLYEVKDVIKTPLSIIFNKSLAEGILPSMWKHANVKPLFKKGSKKSPSNYRPVSLTSICCKSMERILRDGIMNHLESNNLLSSNQHGFRSGRSCVTQLLEIIEIWSDLLDQGIPYDCIYLDYAKAFDKVPHIRLCRKIESHGIKGDLLKWLSNFLKNRTQMVTINNHSSSNTNVISGIPQGSVLGPILFLIYINDISEGINSVIKIFADDTKIFRALNMHTDNILLQIDLDRLLEWSAKWQLPFNVSKCKVIHYGKHNPGYNYYMDGVSVHVDDNEKDLGITFDSNLKFSPHIRAITAKANSRVGILRRNFSNMSPTIFLPLYKALVRPLLEYGSVIWSPKYVFDQLEIEKVQRRATKLVGSICHRPYNERLKELKLDSLKFRRRRSDVIQVFRILNGIDNLDPSLFFSLNTDQRTRGHSKKLLKLRANSSDRLNSFSMRIINDWNNLKNSTVNSTSINAFKTALKHEWSDHPERFLD